MSELWKISDCTIVGAPLTWTDKVPFARSKPLVQHGSHVAQVEKYEGDSVHVAPIASEAFEGITLPPVPLTRDAEVWLLRSGFVFRDEAVGNALEAKIVLHGPKEEDTVVWMVVDFNIDASETLKEWCERAEVESIEHAAKHEFEHAVVAGRLTYTLCDAAKNAGLFLAVLELARHTQEEQEVSTYLDMVRGWHFYQRSLLEKQIALTRIFKRRCEWLLAARHELEHKLASLREENEALALQAKAGNSDPVTDPQHPGNLLLQLGWRYSPGDPYACEWVDPQLDRGSRSAHALPSALGIALRRILGK